MQKLPDATFANLYGPPPRSRATVSTTWSIATALTREACRLGNAFPNRRVLVLDEAGHPVTKPGQEGELWGWAVRIIALGYYGDRKRTEAAFVQNPLAHALPETLYKTGDRVSVGEGGELFFCGRIDNQIKHLGHRIELEEIDAAFEREPSVKSAAAAPTTKTTIASTPSTKARPKAGSFAPLWRSACPYPSSPPARSASTPCRSPKTARSTAARSLALVTLPRGIRRSFARIRHPVPCIRHANEEVMMTDSHLTDAELSALAQAYGTPLYVFDERVLAERVHYLRSVFQEPLELCFAMKANPFVLPEATPLVDRIEVCSAWRIPHLPGARHTAVEARHLRRVQRRGNHRKRPRQHATARSGDDRVQLGQLDLVEALANRRGERVRVLLRLSDGSQFGMDRQDLIEAARRVLAHEHLDALGIQLFTGTQKTSLARLGRELDALSSLMLQLERALGWRPKELEIGPGLPIAYFPGDDLDEHAFLTAYARMLASLAFDGRIVLELGRGALSASCGAYLTRVVDTKRVSGRELRHRRRRHQPACVLRPICSRPCASRRCIF